MNISIEQFKKMKKDEYVLLNYFEDSKVTELDAEEIKRYDRQMILPQVGLEGQKKLKKAKVLIIGAGGLGSPAALYLAGAGVGTVGIVDNDVVSLSNLQRQILHDTERENSNKAESAKATLEKLNDKITVKAYPYSFTSENAEELISEYDFIIDAADNFETKFLINDVCVLHKKPFCHAGVLRFEGQVMTYVPETENPCYRCIFEEIPNEGEVPNCSQTGVLGAAVGVIGSVQALEAIKYILGIGELLTGKMFVFDGLTMKSRIAKFPNKNAECKVCGSKGILKDIRNHAGNYEKNGCRI